MWFRQVFLAFFAMVTICAAPVRAQPLMQWPDLLDRPRPHPTAHIAYGTEPDQAADLWLPEGHGPFPVVLMVHGGCWTARIAHLDIMNYIAEDLRQHGVAVWNIEYRMVDDPGGGYPGTFLDVAHAADKLREIAPAHSLRLNRVVAFGHSAGGHLALWVTARSRLPRASPLFMRNPLPISAVISSGGLPDLEADKAAGDDAACGPRVIDRLVGAPSTTHSHVYADTSVADLLPFSTRQEIVNGDSDGTAPPWLGQDYFRKAQAARANAAITILANTGHVELIAPDTPAWAQERALILRLLR